MNSLTMYPMVTAGGHTAEHQRAPGAMGPQLAAQAYLQARAAAGSKIAWVFFVSLNGLAIMRPGEIFPFLESYHLYEINILLCLFTAMPAVLEMVRARLLSYPLTLCVMGMLFAILASTLPHGDMFNAEGVGIEFAKVLTYFLLLISLAKTPERIRQLLGAIAIFALVLTVVALLGFHHLIHLATVQPLHELQYFGRHSTKVVYVDRLKAAGTYGNPNDLSRIIDVGLTICLYFILRKGALARRVFWIMAAGVLTYGLALTYSRGGLLALIAGLVILFHARYGMKKGAFLILLLLPALAIFGGRQTDITTSTGTGQLRVRLWSEGLVALRSSPIFGIGAGHYFHMAGNHAHNSFVEAYVETGIFGGTLFASAFFLATTALFRFNTPRLRRRARALWDLRPYILSLVVGTIVSQFSSSREYSLPTYVILGLAAAFMIQADKESIPAAPRLSPNLVVKLSVFSILTLAVLHLYTKFNAHF